MLNLAVLLEDSAREAPTRTAVIFNDMKLPYAAVNADTNTGSTGSNYGPLNPALVNLQIEPSKLAPGQIASLSSEEIEKLGIVQKRIYELRKADAENTAAVALYRGLGFTRWDMDVMYGQVATV